ncbi:MAG: hypothetical protein HKN21_15210 [Candidatus Eisenbacteria bacterium]|uniref:DUF5683 domain-containing protein n=1 Tax=Eiseniibacteriota bacterium TaxID=2212470 RepID=A0A7Y2EA94_UNCEI|nr:hypothetical protein [Candidatus Eisenbacteria bacterium]
MKTPFILTLMVLGLGLLIPGEALALTPAAVTPSVATSLNDAVSEEGNPDLRLLPSRVYSASAILESSEEEFTGAQLRNLEGYKDPRLAMLYSLLLPGLGEMWLGHTTRAKAFFVAEAGVWTAFGIFETQGSHREKIYKEYAADFAGVPVRDDNEFYRIIGNFPAAEGPFSANEAIRRQARALFPNNRGQQESYVGENGYFGDSSWEWQTQEEFNRYRELRSRSLDSYNNADLTLGLLLVNRLASVVDAGLLANKRNKSLAQDQMGFHWSVEPGSEGPSAKFVLARNF